jgi:hypothetical protein
MILGISASGRKGKVTEGAVMEVLKSTGHEYRFISLHGKREQPSQ